jgi:ribosome-binding protein aMBF1 (putative translation factor)
MSPTRLRECLAHLRWSQRSLADALTCDERLVRRWAAGQADVPEDVASWLEQMGSVMALNPPPQTWRRRAA